MSCRTRIAELPGNEDTGNSSPWKGKGGMMENRAQECEDEGVIDQNQMQAESPVLSQTQTSCSLLAYPSK